MSVQELIQSVVAEELLAASKQTQLVPVQTRSAPQRRILIRFADPYDISEEEFKVNKEIDPLEYRAPAQRIPLATKTNKGAQEEMMYYVQYVLQQFRQASNLFASFHCDGDVITVVFDCPNGFSIAYDFKLYCAGDWMLQDCNISQSYHFTTWGDIDFAILNMLLHARMMIEKVFHQPLTPANWEEGKPILVFVPAPKRSMHSDSESSDGERSSRSHKTKSSKAKSSSRRRKDTDSISESSDEDNESSSSEDHRRSKKPSKVSKRK